MSRKNNRANRNQLRKIVDWKNGPYGAVIEILECGHEQRRKEDIYGPTNANRRRCRQCAQQMKKLNPLQEKHMKSHPATPAKISGHNQIVLPDGTQISVYGVDQRIKTIGFTFSPLTYAGPELLDLCREALMEAKVLMGRGDTLRSKKFIDRLEAVISGIDESEA